MSRELYTLCSAGQQKSVITICPKTYTNHALNFWTRVCSTLAFPSSAVSSSKISSTSRVESYSIVESDTRVLSSRVIFQVFEFEYLTSRVFFIESSISRVILEFSIFYTHRFSQFLTFKVLKMVDSNLKCLNIGILLHFWSIQQQICRNFDQISDFFNSMSTFEYSRVLPFRFESSLSITRFYKMILE